jgi:hypothetical protein
MTNTYLPARGKGVSVQWQRAKTRPFRHATEVIMISVGRPATLDATTKRWVMKGMQ